MGGLSSTRSSNDAGPGVSPTTLGGVVLTDLQPSSKFVQADGSPFDPALYPAYAALMNPLTDVIDSLCHTPLFGGKFIGPGEYTSGALFAGTNGITYVSDGFGKNANIGQSSSTIFSSSTVLFFPKVTTDSVRVTTDGITFTPHTLSGAILTGFGGVANGHLFVFDSDGSIWHSVNDGSTWTHITAVTTGATGPLNDVAWNGSLYAFVGDGIGAGEIITTPDLAVFTPRVSAGTGPIKCTHWNATLALFVSGGTNLALAASEIQTSTNGNGWTLRTSTGTIINRILAANTNILVALGDVITTSANGTAWTQKLACAQTVLYAAYDGTGITAGIAGGGSDYVVTSSDAITFTETVQNISGYFVPIQNWVNGHAQNVPAWVQVLP
jgi:hypothetical protein